MSLHIISYDLIAPNRNYEPLYSELLRLGAARVLLSQWVMRSDFSSLQLRNHLWQFMDRNDRLLVIEIGKGWAGYNLLADPNQF